MRPVISYRCEGAGGGGLGKGDHVVFGRISRRQQITRTDFDCRSTANEGRSLQSLRGVGEIRKILPQNMFMASVRMSPLYTSFASFNKWLYHLIFYGKKLRIRAEGPNNESRTQILPFNCNWAAWPWTVDSRLPNDNLCFRIQRNWM